MTTVEITPHPPWVVDFLSTVTPCKDRIVHGKLFSEMASGELSMPRFRGALLYFYPLIENFPKYMGLTLSKIPEGDHPFNNLAREWLLTNMNIERRHAQWYRQWAVDFGVRGELLRKPVVPPPEMYAVNNYLWHVVSHGTLIEAICAVNFGIEGPTGFWAKLVERNIRSYKGKHGVVFQQGTLTWLKAHAAYDDAHPDEALELVKLFAKNKADRQLAQAAAQRSMEYYAIAADACYDLFD